MTLPQFDTHLSDIQMGLPDPVITKEGSGLTGIDYQILGTTVQTLLLRLNKGERVYTESGKIGWMTPNIVMNTGTRGGLGAVFKRVLGGSSVFLVEYGVQEEEGLIAFTSSFPGRIVPVHLHTGQEIVVQKRRFLCAEITIKFDIGLQKSLGPTLLGGMDLIMHSLSGSGVAFVCLDGDVLVYTLEADQVLKVDPELIAMYDPTISLDVEMMSGWKNILFSGRKIYQVTLRGPGRVFLQTMAIDRLARALSPYLPKAAPSSSARPHTTSSERTSRPESPREPQNPEDNVEYGIFPGE
jgi:uncharacterized protein (TIGR00266 family)